MIAALLVMTTFTLFPSNIRLTLGHLESMASSVGGWNSGIGWVGVLSHAVEDLLKTLLHSIQSNLDLILALRLRISQLANEEAKGARDGGEGSDSNHHETKREDAARCGDWRGVAVSHGRARDDCPPKNFIGGIEGDLRRDGWRKVGPCLGPEHTDTTADGNDDAEKQDSREYRARSGVTSDSDGFSDTPDDRSEKRVNGLEPSTFSLENPRCFE
jgi:hypothetical protein